MLSYIVYIFVFILHIFLFSLFKYFLGLSEFEIKREEGKIQIKGVKNPNKLEPKLNEVAKGIGE
jgi:hypothetical protein